MIVRLHMMLVVAALCLIGACLSARAAGEPPAAPEATTEPTPEMIRLTQKRGLTGILTIEDTFGDQRLRAVPDQDLEGPILVRVERIDSQESYAVRFFGAVEGSYDLSGYIETVRGEPVEGLGPLWVRVASDLPPDAGSTLYESELPGLGWIPWYGATAVLVALGWLAVPVTIGVRRFLRARDTAPESGESTTITLADQLRPLVIEASSGQGMSPSAQARLELLLYGHWRDQLGLRASAAGEAIATLRRHTEAGELIRAVEGWLHRPGGGGTADGRVTELLEPYAKAPALDLDDGTNGVGHEHAAGVTA